jgi:hypothetical protein
MEKNNIMKKTILLLLIIGMFLIYISSVSALAGDFIASKASIVHYLDETGAELDAQEEIVRTDVYNGTASHTNWVTGQSDACGNAFDFNEEAYVWIDTLANTGTASQVFSEAFWFKMNDNTVVEQRFISHGGDRFRIGYSLGGGDDVITLSGHNMGILNTAFKPVNGVWYHLALTVDTPNSLQNIYINGKLNATSAFGSSIGYVGSRCLVFGTASDDCSSFAGPKADVVMDDVNIFLDYILTPDNVTHLYNDGSCIPHPFDSTPPADTTPPTIATTSQNNTAPRINDVVQIGNKCTDETAISSMWYANNITGELLNKSSINSPVLVLNYTVNITNTLIRNNVVESVFTCNDTGGNSVQSSSVTYSVEDTPLPQPTILLPTNNDYNNTQPNYPFKITYPSDPDGDAITSILWYINGVLNQTTTTNTTFNASDGYYELDVGLSGTTYGANASVNFTIDTTLPTLLFFNLTNNTIFGFNTDATMNITIQDTNPYNLTFRFYNASNPSIFTSHNDIPTNPTTISLVYNLALTTLASGNYSMEINFSDRHTALEIQDYETDIGDGILSFRTDEGNDISIIQTTGNIKKTDTTRKIDRYTMEFGKEDHRKWKNFLVTATKPIKIIQDSRWKGHLIASDGISGNWIDFENTDKESIVTMTRVGINSVMVSVYSEDFNFNSIGGLNTVNVFYNFQVDNDLPSFPKHSISDTTPSPSAVVTLAHTCSDFIGLSTCILAHNNTGVWRNVTNTTMGDDITNTYNQSYALTLTAPEGATVGTMACANDTFNEFACSNKFTLQVDDVTKPIINGTINSTLFYVNQTINATFNVTDNFALQSGQVIITEDDVIRYFNFTLSGNVDSFSQNFSINTAAGNSINITGLVNDIYGNKEFNDTIIYVTKDVQLTANNVFDGSKIQEFSATISNSTYSQDASTTTGTILFIDIVRGLYDINISSEDNGGYFNRTYTDFNATNNLVAELHQAVVYYSAVRRGTDVDVIPFNASVPGAFNQSNSTGGLRLYLNASSYTVDLKSDDYNDIAQSINLTPKSTSSFTAEFYDINVSISVSSVINNIFLKNFTIELTGDSSVFSENLTADNVGNVTFSLGNNTYDIIIGATGYSPVTTSFYIGSESANPNITFSIYGLNAVNFSVYDEVTNEPMDETANLFLVGSTYIRNASTTNGLLYLQDLSAQEYRITYSASGFTERDYYVTIENGTNRSIRLYLLSIENSTDTTVTVKDENVNEVDNATIKLLRHFTDINGYREVAMSRTDSSGVSQMNLENYNAFYYFVIEKGGTTLLTTNPSRIIDTELSYVVFVGDDIFKSRGQKQLISHDLDFNNVSEQFRYVYNDAGNIMEKACLKVDKVSARGQTVVCDECLSSSSGTLICQVNTTEGTHRAFATIHTSTKNSPYVEELITIMSKKAQESVANFRGLGVYMTSYLFMALALLGTPFPYLSILLAIVGIVFSAFMGILGLGYASIATIIIIGALIMFKVKR